MATALVTGSGGLIGAEAARYLCEQGFDVIGLDNDMRAYYFGPDATTGPATALLEADLGSSFQSLAIDIRDEDAVRKVFSSNRAEIELIVHTAAQPSHDWAASEPQTDFTVNANGTLNLLQAARDFTPAATFIFTSTNKVYGDRPNFLPLEEQETRWELPQDHEWYDGVDLTMPIDLCTHSLFGVSKAAADLLVQEYGRYFEMPTVCFRGGCLTGPQHAGAQLHGFLAYLMKCTVSGNAYTVFGYKGKQVRDNIHSEDVARFISEFLKAPRVGEVYNIGGGKGNSCSILEAFLIAEKFSGKKQTFTYSDENRIGDHICYYSDLRKMRAHYPSWDISVSLEETIRQIVEAWGARLA